MIRNALNSLPSRPALIIAPLIVAVVLTYYYWNLYSTCLSQVEQRKFFENSVKLAEQSSGELSLAEITGFPWQHVKGFEAFQPKRESRNCPFGWDWPGQDRGQIIKDGLLSVFIFFNEGTIAHYMEFRGDMISMEGFDRALTPEQARFSVKALDDGRKGYKLTLVP